MAFTVSIILIEPAESMTGELACGMSEHIHNENCFTYTCGLENDENHVHSAECRTLTCGKTEHAHSENCYIHEDEQTAEIMQINEPEIFDEPMAIANNVDDIAENESSADDSSEDEGISSHDDENPSPEPKAGESVPNDYFDGFDTGSPFDFGNSITGASGSAYGDVENNSRNATFSLNYQLEKNKVSKGQPYIYYQLDPANLSIVNPPLQGPVYDADYTAKDGGHISGYYYIDEDGLIKIRFTDEYLEAKKDEIAQNGLKGSIGFEARVQRSADNDGDQDLYFNGHKVTIKFPANELDVEKSGELEKEGEKYTGKIKWTITVTDPSSAETNLNLIGYQLSDKYLPENGSDVIVEVTTKDNNKSSDSSTYGSFEKNDDGITVFKFNEESRNIKKITFTYYTDISDEDTYTVNGKTVTNTANLNKDGETPKSDSATVTVPPAASMTKSGTPDYKIEGYEVDGKIHWKITLKSNYKDRKLTNYQINDAMFPDNIENFIVAPPNAIAYDSENKTVTITDESAEEVTIEYDSDATNYNNWQSTANTCYLTYSHNETTSDGGSKTSYVTYNAYGFEKSGTIESIAEGKKRIKWNIKINSNDQNNVKSVENFKVIDKMFAGLTDGNYEVSGGATFTKDESDTSRKTYLVTGDLPITITYYTEVNADTFDSDSSSVSNTATFGEGGKLGSVTAEVKKRDKFEKTLLSRGKNSSGIELPTEGIVSTEAGADNIYKPQWQIHLVQDDGFGAGKNIVVDVLKATSGGKHYITQDQLDKIEIFGSLTEYAAASNETKLGSDKYEITSTTNEDGEITGFTITLKDVASDIIDILIKYYTTVDISGVAKDGAATFTNEATYNDKKQSPNFTFENVDASNPIYDKYIVDKDGNIITEKNFTRSLDEVLPMQFDGEDYYVFTWVIKIQKVMDIKEFLPEGFELCEDTSLIGSGNVNLGYWEEKNQGEKVNKTNFYPQPMYWWFENDLAQYLNPCGSIDVLKQYGNDYYYDKSHNTIDFNKRDGNYAICFSARIKASVLKSKVSAKGYQLSNTITGEFGGVEYAEKTVTETLTPGKEHILKKDYKIDEQIKSDVTFTIDFNPDAKEISSSDRITLTDVMTIDDTVTVGESVQNIDLDKLSIFLQSLKIYEVLADGSRNELPNNYLYTFTPKPVDESGQPKKDDDNKNIVAELSVSVLDARHLQIEYTYRLSAKKDAYDANTPVSALLANTVSTQTKAVTDSATKSNIEIFIQDSKATSSTFPLPTIEKVDIGNYLDNNLDATFYLAKYKDGKWQYAETITEDGKVHDVQDWTAISGKEIGDLTISELTENLAGGVIQKNSGQQYEIKLESNTLYALLETDTPNGYQKVDGKPLIYYFVYDKNADVSYPNTEGFDKNNVRNVQAGGTVYVPNNKIIDVSAKKTWGGMENIPSGTEVQLTLYWSYTYKNDGTFPNDLHELKLTDGLVVDENGKVITGNSTFQNPITITGSSIAEWKNLLNGKDGKSVYYYVRETAYKVGETTYSLNGEKYLKDGTGETVGDYYPVYENNALNEDGKVEISNYNNLAIEKLWYNAKNEEISPPKGVTSIHFNMWGVKEVDGKETYYQICPNNSSDSFTLSSGSNWKITLTQDKLNNLVFKNTDGTVLTDSDKPDFKEFTDFYIEEILDDDQQVKLYGYKFDYKVNVVNGTGKIELINKDTSATEIDVTINKIWADGNANHDGVIVKLYQTTADTMTNPTGTVLETATLSKENNWTVTFDNLPAKNKDNETYHYFAFEESVPTDYKVKYEYTSTNNGQTIDVINYKEKSISVEKKWVDQTGKPVTPSDSDSIKVNIYRREIKPSGTVKDDDKNLNVIAIGDSITRGGYSATTPEVPLEKRYPSKLKQLLEANGYTIPYNYTNINYGVDGETIDQIKSRLDSIPLEGVKAVCLLAGTNDITQNYLGSVDEIFERLKALITEIQNKNSGIVIFVGTVPHFDFVNANGVATHGSAFWNRGLGETGSNNLIDQLNQKIKTLNIENVICVDVCSVVEKDTMLIDGCHPNEIGYEAIARAFAKAINKNYTGAESLADESVELDINEVPDDLLNAIKANTSSTPNKGTKFGDYEYVDSVEIGKDNKWKQTIEGLDVSSSDSHEYVYYFVEVDEEGNPVTDSKKVQYEHNGQKSESRTGIIITNTKQVPKADLQVEKIWHDGSSTSRPNITFTLERKTDSSDWVAVENPQFKWTSQDGNTWLGKFSGLDVYTDINKATQYYYRVKEVFPDGSEKYIVEYSDNQEGVQIKESPAENKLKVTNTKDIDLNLQKVWNGGSDNKVTFKVHRGILDKVPENENLAFAEKEGYSSSKPAYISTNGEMTLTFNQTIKDWKISPDESNITVTKGSDGKTLVIKAGADTGEYTLTVTHGKETLEIKIVVSAFTIEASPEKAIIGGDGITLTAKDGGSEVNNDVTYTLKDNSQSEFVTIDGDKVTAQKYTGNDIIIVGTYGEKQAEVTIHVAYSEDKITLTGDKEVEINGSITLTPNPNYGTFTYSAEPANAVELTPADDGKSVTVTGKTEDATVKITATRDDGTKSEEFPLTVTGAKEFAISQNGVKLDGNNNFTIYVGDELVFTTTKDYKIVEYDGNNVKITQESRKFTVQGLKETGGTWVNVEPAEGGNRIGICIKIDNYEKLKFTSYPEKIETADTSEYTVKTNKPATFSVSGGSIEIVGDYENVDAIKVKSTGSLGSSTISAKCDGKNGEETDEVTIEVVQEIGHLNPQTVSVESGKAFALPYSNRIVALKFEFSNNYENGSFGLGNDDNWDGSAWSSSVNCIGGWKNYNNYLSSKSSFIIRKSDFGVTENFKYLYSVSFSGNLTLTIYYDENDIPEETAGILSRQGVRLMSVSDFDVVATVTLKETDTVNGVKWAKILENLPAYDDSGNAYYYWVEEVDAAGYDVTYQYFDGDEKTEFDDTAIDAENAGDAKVVVTNTKTESSTTTMPSTGGNGARKYYTVGGMLLLMSACGWAMRRRKRVIPH